MAVRISVVIPCYNEADYLADAIRSLHQQAYAGEYEIVVVDNNSTDATVDIARGLGVRVVSESVPPTLTPRIRRTGWRRSTSTFTPETMSSPSSVPAVTRTVRDGDARSRTPCSARSASSTG
jgi:cellulose synthase/poly-beta-1,6-N-acetylglucosamine synthase-like glycosyltransferase